jgi:hypothetical protein
MKHIWLSMVFLPLLLVGLPLAGVMLQGNRGLTPVFIIVELLKRLKSKQTLLIEIPANCQPFLTIFSP